MFINVNDVKLFYKRNDGKGIPCLLLHGWGASSELMDSVYNFLTAKQLSAVSVDLPAFGQSGMPKENWGIYDYAQTIKEFLYALGIQKCNIVGHSFGGRIAIILAAKTELAQNIVLVDAAGARPRRGIKYYAKVLCYKVKKRLKLNTLSDGSSDYRALDEKLKGVFNRVVNTHLDKLFKDVKCSALIVWGAKDVDTPMYMAKRLEKRIPDSALVVLEDCGHFSYLERPIEFNLILYALINNK